MKIQIFLSDSRHGLSAFDFSSRRRIFLEPTDDLVGDVVPLSHLGAQWGHFLDLLLELIQDLLHGQTLAFRKWKNFLCTIAADIFRPLLYSILFSQCTLGQN